jgi:hypothetical protein
MAIESNPSAEQLQTESQAIVPDTTAAIPLKQFLEEFPINTPQKITNYYEKTDSEYHPFRKQTPQLRIWCNHNDCQGFRRFEGEWQRQQDVTSKDISRDFLTYKCRDCGVTEKTFCLLSAATDQDGNGVALKIGEIPEVHIQLPSGLPTLLGTDYQVFIKGLKCEKQGLGLGAFSYYRRVVENQKGRLFEQILRVAKRLGASQQVIGGLERAAIETQFSKAVDDAKDYIPASLLIDGHNPMKLLHRALSIGIHAADDETCLKVAHSIRMVLQDMSQRIKDTLREERELKSALSDLLQFNKER